SCDGAGQPRHRSGKSETSDPDRRGVVWNRARQRVATASPVVRARGAAGFRRLRARPSARSRSSTSVMRALLVDDEPLARRELRRLLADHPWVEIVGEASNIAEAERQVIALAPALMFLDIQMPGGTGFDLLERLERLPQVIFTTAYDHHAVRAFEVDAI